MAAIIVTLINAACLVTNTLLPLLLQTALGASAFETGMAMLPAAAVGIIISPISGVVFDKFGPRVISVVGLALMTARCSPCRCRLPLRPFWWWLCSACCRRRVRRWRTCP